MPAAFSHRFRVRDSEVDRQGIVFNANYLTYFDTAITEFFRAVGYDYKGEPQRSGGDFHVVKTVVEYRAPIGFDELIDVHVAPARLGRSSLAYVLTITAPEGPELRATGEVVWVFADQETHRSRELPADLRALLEARMAKAGAV